MECKNGKENLTCFDLSYCTQFAADKSQSPNEIPHVRSDHMIYSAVGIRGIGLTLCRLLLEWTGLQCFQLSCTKGFLMHRHVGRRFLPHFERRLTRTSISFRLYRIFIKAKIILTPQTLIVYFTRALVHFSF